MIGEERIKSILRGLEHDYISYGNLHDDNEHGCRTLKYVLGKAVPMKPVKVKYEKGEGYSYRCPRKCKKHGGYVCVSRWQNYCCNCGQRIDWEGAD